MRWPTWVCAIVICIAGAAGAADTPAVPGPRRYVGLEYARVGELPLRMDLHVPASAGAVPVVIYIHGGDWMFGNRSGKHPLFLLQEGIAVASIDYRLAPGFRFPAQARDCHDALVFLHENAARYRIDPARIGVMGESAGGHLAALLGLATDDPALKGTRTAKARPAIRAIVSVAGPMDIEMLGDMGDLLEGVVGRHPIQQLLGGRTGDKRELARLASPIRHISADDPPMLLISGEKDFVVPAMVAQAAASEAGAGQAGLAHGYTSVIAPYGGVVAARLVEVGEMVLPGKPLMTGFDPSEMRVVVSVPQYKLAEIGARPEASVEIPSLNRSIKAATVTVQPIADARTHTTQVRVYLPANEPNVYPGMFVRAHFVVGKAKKLTIPSRAVLRRSEVVAVYVVDDKGGMKLRQVRLGEESDGLVEVLAGLKPGERVALDPVKAGMSGRK